MHKSNLIYPFLVSVFLLVNVIQPAKGQAPPLINFQASITSTDPVVSVTFEIFDVEKEGVALWREKHTTDTVQNGVIRVLLGSVNMDGRLAELFNEDGDRYLQIRVNDSTMPLEPRLPITSVAYALRSATADGSNGDFVIRGKTNVAEYQDAEGNNILTADVNASSMEIGGSAPTSENGQATLYLHDHGDIAHQLRYALGTLHLEAAGNGYGTNSTPSLVVGGKLGIGTDNPLQQLHIDSSVQPQILLTNSSSNSKNSVFQIGGPGLPGTAGSSHFFISNDWTANNTDKLSIGYDLAGTWEEYVRIATNGFVGLGSLGPFGVATPGFPLHMANGAHVTEGGVWMNASSRDKKTDFKALTVEEALSAVLKLKPLKYRYKSQLDEEQYVGFVAEDVPELVATKDRNALSSMDIVAVLTKVVQEQQRTIQVLKIEVEELKERVR